MRLLKIFPALSALLLVSACASIIDGPTQPVRIDTPGATEAECFLVNGVKYRAVTGETLKIMRSHRDLVVDCYASGDRHKQIVVESSFNGWGAANVTNGVIPGGTYDHYSGGLYTYPEIITIDFVGIPTRGFETPAYHNKDAPNPYKQAIEGYGAGSPAIPEDSEYLRRGLEKRSTSVNSNPFSSSASALPGADSASPAVTPMPATAGSAPAMTPSKPNLSGANAEQLTRSANPTVFNK